MRRALLCAILISLFVSCTKSQSSSSEDTLDKIRRTGQIDACVVIDPPFAFKDQKSGVFSGVNPDMMAQIAQKMNAKINWHETTWGNAAADLAAGRCDVMSDVFMVNIPRALTVAFTQPPLAYMGLTALVRKNDPRFQHVKDPYVFDKPKMTVVVATGEVGDLFVKDHFKHAERKEIDVESSDLTRFCVEVSAKRADVAIAATDEIAEYAQHHPEVVDLFHDQPFSLHPMGLAVRQDDFKWLQFLNTALQFLETQGTIAELEKKYNAHWIHLVKQYKLQ